MDEVIKAVQLTKAYKGNPALKNVSLSVQRGTVFCLLGANGAGKSTAIECILGTKAPDKGEVSILGYNPRTQRKRLFQKVGVQFQEANYQDKITADELCQATAALYRQTEDYQRLLREFGIASLARHQVSSLSGGERQRLFLVLALIPKPEVVFLDELTTGLDPKARRQVWENLNRLKAKGLTVFLTSHYMDEVETLCDKICILAKGEVIYSGTVTDAIAQTPHESLEDAYLWFTEKGESKE